MDLSFFFFNDTATTEIYTLSLHDALPISAIGYYGDRGDEVLTEESAPGVDWLARMTREWEAAAEPAARRDRKSTRLNSSHGYISYAVFCLKKKTTLTAWTASRF